MRNRYCGQTASSSNAIMPAQFDATRKVKRMPSSLPMKCELLALTSFIVPGSYLKSLPDLPGHLANSQLWGELCCLLEGCWGLCLFVCWWLVVPQFYMWLDAISWARAPAKQGAAQWMHRAENETTKSLQMANKYICSSIYSIDIKEQKRNTQHS